MKPTLALRNLFLGSTLLAAVIPAHAQNTWDNGGGTSSWGLNTNWSSDTLPAFSGSTTDIVFDGTAAGTTFLGGNRAVRSITFTSAATTSVVVRPTTTLAGTSTASLAFGTAAVAGSITVESSSGVHSIGETGVNSGTIVMLNNLTVTNNGGTLGIYRPITHNGFSIIKEGSATLQYNTAYAGITQINAGSLLSSNVDNYTGSFILNGSTAKLRISTTAAQAMTRAIEIRAGGGIISKGGNNANFHTWSGTVTTTGTGARTLTLESDSGGFGRMSSLLSDAAGGVLSLTKTNTGTWNLNAANTFTGATTISNGFLVLENASALQNSYIDTTNSNGSATIGLRTTGAALNLGGLTGTRALADVYTSTTGGYDTITTLTLKTATGADLTYSGNLSANADGTGTKAAALVKTGAGKQTLSGISRYTGATTVSGGTLAVNGQLANTSSVTVGGTGATLQGSGTINSSVAINSGGTLASGNSIESLEITGDLTQATGSTFAYEMDRSETDANLAGDLTVVGGAFNLAAAAGSTLTLTELGLSGAWSGGDTLTLIAYTGAWNNNLFTYLGTPLADDSTFNFSGIDWTFNYNDILPGDNYTADLNGGLEKYVTMTAIPEPGAALLGGLGVLLLLRRRR